MALIICPECGKEISDKAILCPNCGYPIAEHFLEQRKNAKEKELLARIKPLEFQCPPSRVKVCVKCGKPFDIHYKPQCSCGFCGTEVDYPLQQLEFDDVFAELYILRHELPARNIGDNDSGEYQKMLQDVRDMVSALELYYKENGVTHYSFNPGPPSKVWYGTMEGYKSPSPMSGFSEFANAVASAREKGFSIICPVCHTGTNQVTDKTEACPICGHKQKSVVASVGQRPHKENVPKCPICGSTNLSKITVGKKAAKISILGLFGMGDAGKTWKCNNCGSKF